MNMGLTHHAAQDVDMQWCLHMDADTMVALNKVARIVRAIVGDPLVEPISAESIDNMLDQLQDRQAADEIRELTDNIITLTHPYIT